MQIFLHIFLSLLDMQTFFFQICLLHINVIGLLLSCVTFNLFLLSISVHDNLLLFSRMHNEDKY